MAFILVFISTTAFSLALPYVETLRIAHPEIMFAMPLLIGLIWWDRIQPRDVLSTRAEVRALHESVQATPRPIRALAGAKQILMTLAAHLAGASVGREAVGLQLGGWATRMRNTRGWYFGACLAAGFAIILGTPITAAVFIFESRRWSLDWLDWLGVSFFAWFAFQLSSLVGVQHHAYRSFSIAVAELSAAPIAKLVLFALMLPFLASLLSFLFLKCVDRIACYRESDARSSSARVLLRSFFFLSLVTGLFYGLGFSSVENLGLPGLGIRTLEGILLLGTEGSTVISHPLFVAFIKVTLTAAFVGIGVRGGEMTPLLAAGAMLGVGLGLLLQLPVTGLIAIGLPLIWGIAARRPVCAAVLAIELFGFSPWGVLAIITYCAVGCSLKIGDDVSRRMNRANAKDPGVWHRGLYD